MAIVIAMVRVVMLVMMVAAVAVVVVVGGRSMKALSLKCSGVCFHASGCHACVRRATSIARKRNAISKLARPNTRGACANRGRYFGGVVAFNQEDFEKINGFPNTFWGWGGEDDEMYSRIVEVTEPNRVEA